MQITIDETKLNGLSPEEVLDTIRGALSRTISEFQGCSGYGDCEGEQAILRALPERTAPLAEPHAPSDVELHAWIGKVHTMREEYRREHFPNLSPEVLTVEKGRKYAPIVVNRRDGGGGRSVFCFVSLETGDILKAHSWKRPAKHVRGNIFAANPLEGVTQYGAAYMR